MKIFKGSIENIEKEIDTLSKLLFKINKNNELDYYHFLSLITGFNSVLLDATGKNSKVLEENPKLFFEEMLLSNKYYKKNNDSVMKNKSLYSDILLSINSFINDSLNLEIKNLNINMNKKSNYSEDAIYEIIEDYLKKYHKENSDLIKKLVLNNSIYLLDIFDNGYGGYTITNDYTNNQKIIIDKKASDIGKMISLVHEIGHVYDDLDAMNRKNYAKYNVQSSYREVISSMYEKEFLEFLISENIDKDIAKKYLDNYYTKISILFNRLYVTSKLDDKILESEEYLDMSRVQILESVSYNPLIEQSQFKSGEELDIYFNASYGFGKLLGVYFSNLKENDKNKYINNFQKFLSIRSRYFNPNIFENIGTTRNEVFEVLKKEKEKVFIKK